MQKYILGADIGNDCAMIMPIDDKGYTGKWQRYNAGIVYKAEEVDAALAAKDRDLADANHALLLANSNADAFSRVAEQKDAALRNCLMLAMRRLHRCSIESEHWEHIVRFCKEAGVEPSILRTTGSSNG